MGGTGVIKPKMGGTGVICRKISHGEGYGWGPVMDMVIVMVMFVGRI